MSKYLIKGQPPSPGCYVLVDENNSPLKLIRLSRILLTPSKACTRALRKTGKQLCTS